MFPLGSWIVPTGSLVITGDVASVATALSEINRTLEALLGYTLRDHQDMSRQDRFMVVGAVGAGKTSSLLALKGFHTEAAKTQAVQYDTYGVDTPGEYIENPKAYRYIISLAQEVQCVLMVQAATDAMHHYPPGFVSSLSARVIGVISKADHPEGDVGRAREILRQAGVADSPFVTSSKNREGIGELIQYLTSKLNMPDFQQKEGGS